MGYEMDMGSEKEVRMRRLLPEGKREFTVVSCEEQQSKAGNDMFVIELKDEETGYIDTVYAVATKGKRWFLKQLLSACGIAAGEDGVYKWDIPDILDKKVTGDVVHEPNEYINRNGDKVETTQHRITSFEEVAWDET